MPEEEQEETGWWELVWETRGERQGKNDRVVIVPVAAGAAAAAATAVVRVDTKRTN